MSKSYLRFKEEKGPIGTRSITVDPPKDQCNHWVPTQVQFKLGKLVLSSKNRYYSAPDFERSLCMFSAIYCCYYNTLSIPTRQVVVKSIQKLGEKLKLVLVPEQTISQWMPILKDLGITISSLQDNMETTIVVDQNHAYFCKDLVSRKDKQEPLKIKNKKEKVVVKRKEEKKQEKEPQILEIPESKVDQPPRDMQVPNQVSRQNTELTQILEAGRTPERQYEDDSDAELLDQPQQQPVLILADIPVIQQAIVAQEPEYPPRRVIYPTKTYETNFVLPQKSKDLLADAANKCRLDFTMVSEVAYGHPTLRVGSDLMQKLSMRSTSSSLTIDLGSKYHRFADPRIRKMADVDHVIAYRPDQLPSDQVYHQLHESKTLRQYKGKLTIIKEKVDSKTRTLPGFDVIATDCVYYPGVLDYMCESLMKDPSISCVGSHIQFPVLPGEYDVIEEGKVIINSDNYITFYPKDNGSNYSHQNFIMNAYTTQDIIFTYRKRKFMLREIGRVQYTPQVAQIAWQLHSLERCNTNDSIVEPPHKFQIASLTLDLQGENIFDEYHQFVENDTTSQTVFQAPNYMVDIATGILVDAKNVLSLEMITTYVPQMQREIHKTNARFMIVDEYTQNVISSSIVIAHYRKSQIVSKKHMIYTRSEQYKALSSLSSGYIAQMFYFRFNYPYFWLWLQESLGKIVTLLPLLIFTIIIICLKPILLFGWIPLSLFIIYHVCKIEIDLKPLSSLVNIKKIIKGQPLLGVDFMNTKCGSLATNLHPDPLERPEFYDLESYNDMIIKDLKIQDPLGNEIHNNVYDNLKDYCTCDKNKLKKIGKFELQMENHGTFQYGSCPLNSIAAILGRQGATLLRPDKPMVKDFLRFSKDEIDKIQLPQMSVEDFGWESYYQHVKKKSATKAENYLLARQQFLLDGEIDLTMETFPKVGEKFRGVTETIQKQSNRPRNICNPSNTVKAIGGHMNWILIHVLKQHFPQFIHGLSCDQLCDRIKTTIDQDPRIISPTGIDGSNHDSHQHAELLEVDIYFINKFYPLIFHLLQLPQQHFQKCKVIYNKIDIQIKTFWKKQPKSPRRVFFKFILHGTVCSGHPLRTTLGNTLRVILYMLFVQHLSNTSFSFLVSGDDAYCLIPEIMVNAFTQAFWQVYSVDKFGTHGLGQCAKKLDFLPSNHVDFLSKIGYISNEVTIDRNLDRMIFLQSYTDSKQEQRVLAQTQVDSLFSCAPNLQVVRDFVKSQGIKPKVIDMTKASYDIQCHHQVASKINHRYNLTVSNVGDSAGKYYPEDVEYYRAVIKQELTANSLAYK